jgi:hypothetical protein
VYSPLQKTLDDLKINIENKDEKYQQENFKNCS